MALASSATVTARLFSLQGLWTQPHVSFAWEAAKIFPKQSSENINDYWISYASGACLASNAYCLSARFDPISQYLTFNPRGNRVVDGPWRLLQSPLPPSDWEITEGISSNANEGENSKSGLENKEEQQLQQQERYQYVIFTQTGLKNIQNYFPHLYHTAWTANTNVTANAELMHLAKTDRRFMRDFGGVLQLLPDRQENAIKDEILPHGSKWVVSYLQVIDENERERYRRLTEETANREITWF